VSGCTLSPSFWEVYETKISYKWSQVTPLCKLIEMVQYVENQTIQVLLIFIALTIGEGEDWVRRHLKIRGDAPTIFIAT
jgi:hypothetical protein